jgi:hypothetical protein
MVQVGVGKKKDRRIFLFKKNLLGYLACGQNKIG